MRPLAEISRDQPATNEAPPDRVLMAHPSNGRLWWLLPPALIPHYSLGVWFVITHMGLGMRSVLLAHRVSLAAANRVAWAMSALGAVFALTITVAQLRVHGSS